MTSFRKDSVVNTLVDCKVDTKPVLLTQFGNTRIFRVEVTSKRTSGVVDRFFVNFSSALGVVLSVGDYITVEGDIRTLNRDSSDFVYEGFIYAKSITFLEGEPESYRNTTEIADAELYKFIEARKSYSNENEVIADYQVKLSRGHGRYSYFKATSWGSDAVFIGNMHDRVEYMNIKCRLQSHVSKKSGRLYLCLAVYHIDW